MISKKEISEIRKLKGQLRVAAFHSDAKYLERVEGKEKLEEVRRVIKKVEPDFDLEGKASSSWCPLYWGVLVLLTVKEVCSWGDKEIYEMGRRSPRYSFIVRTILRYFSSFERVCQEAPNYWKKFYSVGSLELGEFNESQKYAVFKIKDFESHPILCLYFQGFFQGLIEITNPAEKVAIKERKCVSKGDKYHEFVVSWK